MHPQSGCLRASCRSPACGWGSRKPTRQSLRLRNAPVRASEEDSLHEAKLGPNVVAGIKEVKESLQWWTATVMRNEAVNLDGTARQLQLSVGENVDLLYGKRVQGVPDSPRWIDSYTLPGQFVGVRIPSDASLSGSGAKKLYSIASSPYESRRDSAYVNASIIEVVVDRHDGEDERLAELGPGSLVEVSQVVGRGFASLFNSYVGLLSAMEEQRNMLLIGVGVRGMAALRAVLNWTPVQAHATARRVTCLYVARCASDAIYLPEWDSWRDAGVQFIPLYRNNTSAGGDGATSASASQEAAEVLDLLDRGLFLHEHGIEGTIGGRAGDCSVLLAGVSGGVASGITKELTAKGVAMERMLFCDYF